MIAFFKQPPCVSKQVRDSARGEECTLRLDVCNFDPETTVFVHIRHFGWAGVGQKPPDYLGFYGCSCCHDVFDGRVDGVWGWEDVMRAHGETLLRLYAKGLLLIKGAQ